MNIQTQRYVFTDDSDVSVTFNGRVRLKSAFVTFVSNGTAGNRQIEFRVKDAAGNVLYAVAAGAVQAASLTRYYLIQPGVAREAAFVNGGITMPMDEQVVPSGGSVQLVDTAAVAAAGDDPVLVLTFEAL